MVKNRSGLWWVIRCLILWFVIFTILFPFLHMLSVSVSSVEMVNQNKVILWPLIGNGKLGITLEAYQYIVSKQIIWTAYKNTIIYAVLGTLISLFILISGSYALSKKRCPGGKIITKLIIFTLLFSGGMIPSFLAIKWLRLLDTIWAVVLPPSFSAINFFIMRSFFLSFPSEIEESGKIDGLNDIGILWHLVLPSAFTMIATIGFIIAVGYWNLFFQPLLYLSDEKKYPLQVILRAAIFQSPSYGNNSDFAFYSILGFSLIIISTIPLLIIYPFLQKYFIKYVTGGRI